MVDAEYDITINAIFFALVSGCLRRISLTHSTLIHFRTGKMNKVCLHCLGRNYLSQGIEKSIANHWNKEKFRSINCLFSWFIILSKFNVKENDYWVYFNSLFLHFPQTYWIWSLDLFRPLYPTNFLNGYLYTRLCYKMFICYCIETRFHGEFTGWALVHLDRQIIQYYGYVFMFLFQPIAK